MNGEGNGSGIESKEGAGGEKNSSLLTKRQRRPSVRLGDIGWEKMYNRGSCSTTSKFRPLTNLTENEVPPKRPRNTSSFTKDYDDYEEECPLTAVHSGDEGVCPRPPPPVPASSLDDSVLNWLLHLGLSRYAPLFQFHEVDDDALPHLTLDDLKDMGISAVGSRRKLYSAILNLRKGFS